jgi:alpha-tubulin suppressor-like RCC1 family protein
LQLVETLARVRIVQVACGCYHTLALSDDGKVYPFGRNNHGQLGLETTRDCLSPQLIPSLRNQFVRKVCIFFLFALTYHEHTERHAYLSVCVYRSQRDSTTLYV